MGSNLCAAHPGPCLSPSGRLGCGSLPPPHSHAPQVLIASAEPATEAPMEDHIKSQNKSQDTLVIPPNVDFNACKVHTKCIPKMCCMCKAHTLSTYKEVMAVQ